MDHIILLLLRPTADVMLRQDKITNQLPLIDINQLASNARPAVEAAVEVLGLHGMNAADVGEKDGDGVLGDVTCEILPDEAALWPLKDNSITVED